MNSRAQNPPESKVEMINARRLFQGMLDRCLKGNQRGGVAIMMLIAFTVLAVPLVLAATQVSDQIVRASMVYNSRLTAAYAADSGVERALAELADPVFRADLIAGLEDGELTPFEINGQEVDVNIDVSVFDPGTTTSGGGYADIVLAVDNSGSLEDLQLDDLKIASNRLVDAFDMANSKGPNGEGRYLNDKDEIPTDFYYLNLSGAANNVFYFLNGRDIVSSTYRYPINISVVGTAEYYLNDKDEVTYSYSYLNDDGIEPPSSFYFLNGGEKAHPFLMFTRQLAVSFGEGPEITQQVLDLGLDEGL